jgi:hypothetical protein
MRGLALCGRGMPRARRGASISSANRVKTGGHAIFCPRVATVSHFISRAYDKLLTHSESKNNRTITGRQFELIRGISGGWSGKPTTAKIAPEMRRYAACACTSTKVDPRRSLIAWLDPAIPWTRGSTPLVRDLSRRGTESRFHVLFRRHPNRYSASRYDRRFDVANANLYGQSFCVAVIDRYAITIRIDQLEVIVTKELVLSNCVYRQSLFH